MWKDGLDYWTNKADIAARIALPIVVFVLGSWLNDSYKAKEHQLKTVELNQQFSQKQSELNQKYIELAVTILNNKPTSETASLRDWAIDIINKYSEVKLSKSAIKVLKEHSLQKPHTIDQVKNFDSIKDFDSIK